MLNLKKYYIDRYKHYREIFSYSDIECLELFQSALLIFVNPFNLTTLAEEEVAPILIWCIYAGIIIGLMNVVWVTYSLKSRLDIAKAHLALCTVILAIIVSYGHLYFDGVVSYYLLQFLTCIFIIKRLHEQMLIARRKK